MGVCRCCERFSNLRLPPRVFVWHAIRSGQVGTGDDFAYPTEAPPMNATLYRQRLSLMKQFGFDFVRLHSHFEAPAYVTIRPRF